MCEGGTDSIRTVPSSSALDISRWKTGLGLDWGLENNSIRVNGHRGHYTIFRLSCLWMMCYFHHDDNGTIPVISKGFREIESAFEEVHSVEKQVLLDHIISSHNNEMDPH